MITSGHAVYEKSINNGRLYRIMELLVLTVNRCRQRTRNRKCIWSGTQEWNECGVSSVSRYAASVVTFTDRKQKEAVFIAGGFKGKDMPCSIIEVLTISG